MPVENEKSFKSSNKCWVCNKLFAAGDSKIKDHDHVTKNIEVLLIRVVILILK